MTESRAYLDALRILTRSDRSRADLEQRLRRREHPREEIEAALARCNELGYLDDQRLAERLSRSFSESGRAVGRRLLLELKKRGIPAPIAAAAASGVDDGVTRQEQLQELLQRRYPGFDPRSAEQGERRRVLGFFQRRGYPLNEILTAFELRAAHIESD